jgi:hypothetical protein
MFGFEDVSKSGFSLPGRPFQKIRDLPFHLKRHIDFVKPLDKAAPERSVKAKHLRGGQRSKAVS